jgi:hypothetical protein
MKAGFLIFFLLGSSFSPAQSERQRQSRETQSGRPALIIKRNSSQLSPKDEVSALTFPGPGTASAAKSEMNVLPLVVDFGDVISGQERNLVAALTIVISSGDDWNLEVKPSDVFVISGDKSSTVPISRMSWKLSETNNFVPFPETGGIVVAQGSGDPLQDQVLVLDLKLTLLENDPVGFYTTQLKFELRRD